MLDPIAHMEWADSCMWETVLENGERDSRIETCLHHLHMVQHAFLSLWRSESLDIPDISSFSDVASIAKWAREAHIGIQEFLAGAEESTLESELSIPWAEQLESRLKGPVESVNVHQSVMQVAMHSAHHRGQAALRLRELNTEPPLLDFIVWLWQGRPRARWSVSETM